LDFNTHLGRVTSFRQDLNGNQATRRHVDLVYRNSEADRLLVSPQRAVRVARRAVGGLEHYHAAACDRLVYLRLVCDCVVVVCLHVVVRLGHLADQQYLLTRIGLLCFHNYLLVQGDFHCAFEAQLRAYREALRLFLNDGHV